MRTTPKIRSAHHIGCVLESFLPYLLLGLFNLGMVIPNRADTRRIFIDGLFDDWTGASTVVDPVGDAPSSAEAVDFVKVAGANDERNIFLHFGFTQPLSSVLQGNATRGNSITLYIDADDDPATGNSISDIGADVIWTFGQRTGARYSSNGVSSFDVHEFQLRFEPMWTSSQYELALPRDLVLGGEKVFTGNQVRVVVQGHLETGDRVPDRGGFVIPLGDEPLPPVPVLPLEKPESTAFRLTTWNSSFAGMFDPSRASQFRRMLQALAPDILVLQEMWNVSRPATLGLVQEWLGDEHTWTITATPQSSSLCLISRYPVLGYWKQSGAVDCIAALLDTREAIGRESFIVTAHLTCCDNDAARDTEVSLIASFLQDAVNPGGRFSVPNNTPVILAGDLNLVGKGTQLTTLLEGRLLQGTRLSPDWDKTPLAQVVPMHNSGVDSYTWRAAPGRHGPGRLDYVIYTDSILTPLRSFVFQTSALTPEQLTASSLRAEDTILASDHAPVTVDFAPHAPVLRALPNGATSKLLIYLARDLPFELQRSDDLKTWKTVVTARRAGATPETILEPSDNSQRRYYRAIRN